MRTRRPVIQLLATVIIAVSAAAPVTTTSAAADTALATNAFGDITAAAAAALVLESVGASVVLVPGSAVLIPGSPTTDLQRFDRVDLSGTYERGGETEAKSIVIDRGIWITSDGGALAPDPEDSDQAAVRALLDASLAQYNYDPTTGFRALQFDVKVASGITSISFELLFHSTESCGGNWDLASIFVDGTNYAFLEWADEVVRVIRVAPGAGLFTRSFETKIGETTADSPFDDYTCQTDLLSVTGIFDKTGKTPDGDGRTTHRVILAVSDTGDNVVPSAIMIGRGIAGNLTQGGITTGPPPGLNDAPTQTPTAPTTQVAPPAPVPDPGGGLPAVAPGQTTGSVAGEPTAPAPSIPSPGTTQYTVGSSTLRLDLGAGGAGAVSGPSSAPVLRATSGGFVGLSGGGMQPGSTTQAWIVLPGGASRPVGVAEVGSDGRFDGAIALSGELDGAGPLPIGTWTLQVAGIDDQGRQTVLNVSMRVQQPGPTAPEADRSVGAVPALGPGRSLATNAGLPTPVTVTPLPASSSTLIQGDGWLLDIAVPGGRVSEVDGAPLMELVRGSRTEVRGDGFMPGTLAYVWLMSTPRFLGQVTVAADGTFRGSLPVTGVTLGEHTLQVSGVGSDGYIRAANIGVVVTASGTALPNRINAGEGPMPLVPLSLALIVALMSVVVTGTGRERALAAVRAERDQRLLRLRTVRGRRLDGFDGLQRRLEQKRRALRGQD